MKKLILFLLVSLSLFSTRLLACGPGPCYRPDGLRIYRVTNYEPKSSYSLFSQLNIDAWLQLTGTQASYDEVYTVVYKASVKDMKHIRNKHRAPKSLRKNAFAKALCRRDDLTDMLILAKECETTRGEMLDPWYYPIHDDPYVRALEYIIEVSRQHETDSLLRDRYSLQMMRAYLSLGRYQEMVSLWENYVSQLPSDNVMRMLMVDYAVGAYQSTGNTAQAAHLRAVEEDFCNNDLTFYRMQKELRDADYDGCAIYYDWEIEHTQSTFARYRTMALDAVQQPGNKRLAEWYYTLAYIDDVMGDLQSSDHYLRLAEQAGGTPFIQESIRLFRFYLDAKMKPLGQSYDARLLTELTWLEDKLLTEIPDRLNDEEMRYYNMFCDNYSVYYWNDVLRRIVLSVVAPRLEEDGQLNRALLLTNYAENVLLKKGLHYDYYGVYCSYFFSMLDTHGSDVTIGFIQNIKKPSTELDRFLLAGCHIDHDFLNDIAGTLLVRESRYDEAIPWLRKVPASFSRNVIGVNPFGVNAKEVRDGSTTRLAFAKEMCRLEKQMTNAADPNERADAKIRFALGLRNSFGAAWEATAYSLNHPYYCSPFRANTHIPYQKKAFERADRLIEEAWTLYTDDERAAAKMLEMQNFRTVMERYPTSSSADFVRSHCENYYDYHLDRSKVYPSYMYGDDQTTCDVQITSAGQN